MGGLPDQVAGALLVLLVCVFVPALFFIPRNSCIARLAAHQDPARTTAAGAPDPIRRWPRPTPHAEACSAQTPSRRASECAITRCAIWIAPVRVSSVLAAQGWRHHEDPRIDPNCDTDPPARSESPDGSVAAFGSEQLSDAGESVTSAAAKGPPTGLTPQLALL